MPGVSYGFPYPTLTETSIKLYFTCYVIANYTKVSIYGLSILECELLLREVPHLGWGYAFGSRIPGLRQSIFH
jgi:hypothetical protein